MLSRIHSQTDVLKNGKIMLLIENDSDCQTLTDLEYAEYALKEILVCNYKAIQEITASKNNVSLGNYIDMLTSLTNNLKIITESLLALKIKTSNPNTKSSTISESLLKEIVKMNQTAQEDRKNALNQI